MASMQQGVRDVPVVTPAQPKSLASRKQVHGLDDESFRLCRRHKPLLGEVALNTTTVQSTKGRSSNFEQCDARKEFRLFQPLRSAPFFKTSCCSMLDEHCSGCADHDFASARCSTCTGGFSSARKTKKEASCQACMDYPSWVDKDGNNCFAVKSTCSDELYQGVSSNMACCECGGGHREATALLVSEKGASK